MNYFAHALPFLDGDPYLVVGTAIPDWVRVVDRRMRARSRLAAPFLDDREPRLAALARGICQHHHDDQWFHQGRAFVELNLHWTQRLREVLGAEPGDFRPSFVAHVLVELLLDATLSERHPGQLKRYYERLDEVDAAYIQTAVNLLATRPSEELAGWIDRFRQLRFLFDYERDETLLGRLNGVLRRVKLTPLPRELVSLLPAMRDSVRDRWDELLAGRSRFNLSSSPPSSGPPPSAAPRDGGGPAAR